MVLTLIYAQGFLFFKLWLDTSKGSIMAGTEVINNNTLMVRGSTGTFLIPWEKLTEFEGVIKEVESLLVDKAFSEGLEISTEEDKLENGVRISWRPAYRGRK